jgi:hypothetical protein
MVGVKSTSLNVTTLVDEDTRTSTSERRASAKET